MLQTLQIRIGSVDDIIHHYLYYWSRKKCIKRLFAKGRECHIEVSGGSKFHDGDDVDELVPFYLKWHYETLTTMGKERRHKWRKSIENEGVQSNYSLYLNPRSIWFYGVCWPLYDTTVITIVSVLRKRKLQLLR